jgi:hypothetical protein
MSYTMSGEIAYAAYKIVNYKGDVDVKTKMINDQATRIHELYTYTGVEFIKVKRLILEEITRLAVDQGVVMDERRKA